MVDGAFYSAMYFHGALAFARRQIVKNGLRGGRFCSAVLRVIQPIVTPRSPLDAMMTRSGAHETGLTPGASPSPTISPIFVEPVTIIEWSGEPRLMASALPNLTNAGPRPIVCASFENARSASSRLFLARSTAAWSVVGATIFSGSAAATSAIDTGAAFERERLDAATRHP